MLSQELVKQIEDEYIRAFQKVRVAQPRLLGTNENFEIVVKFLRSEGLPEVQWREMLFNSALIELLSRNALKLEPTPEEKAAAREQKRKDLEARDRAPGSFGANRHGEFVSETPGDTGLSIGQQLQKSREEFAEKTKKELDDAAAKEAAEKDLSNVPTRAQILASAQDGLVPELPVAEQKRFSRFQHREYLKRLQDVRMTLHARTRPKR